ncbi:MAG: type II toxin-antitoxin system RelE/ParE family toxin [Bacteroidetes bacterium]|nr:type II toxin-antitoxin system RelE/ParE family toxin [Bacteroidota bacterium]
MVKIVWTELSLSDLKEVFDYIAIDSIRYAMITANKIFQRLQPVADNIYLGRMVPEFRRKAIREVREGNYRIIYRIKSKTRIDVLRVFHVARSLKKNNLR